VQTYQRTLELKPDLSEAMFNLGTLLQTLSRWDESIVVFKQALASRPDYNVIYPYLAHSLMQQCNWDNLEAIVQRICRNTEDELAQGERTTVSAFALQSLPGEISMALRQQVAEQIASYVAQEVEELRGQLNFSFVRQRGDRKLRIGYVSPDSRFHSVAVAFKGILDHHDTDRFDCYGYSLNPQHDDSMTDQLAAVFHQYRRISDLPLRDAATGIHDDGIDILLDLAGHTRGAKLGLFSLRLAPIQAHYLGYSATTGARYLDYLITDHQQVPAEQRQFFTEQLVYLPETFMATQRAPVAIERPNRADCGIPEDAFVFMNCNAQYKFEPRSFAIWMRLLRRVPGSVLLLMRSSPGSVANLRKEAEHRGIDADRLIFLERVPHPVHLARMTHADLALDCLYHGGGVTTVDCLWVGVPVLTVTGATPQSRNGATLLNAIGLAELITDSLSDYEELAFTLAGDRDRLRALAARLKQNRDTTPLFNSTRLTRHLERAYEMMWQNYMDGAAPQMIDVPALPMHATDEA